MDSLSKTDLRTLLMRDQEQQCVSIFMPTYRAGAETQQNDIRLKNLLRKAEEMLVERGIRAPEAREMLEPAHALEDNRPFWQQGGDGLALFLAPGLFRYYCLPVRFEELVIVNERFHVKPLLPLLNGNGEFYILALSQKHVRLLKGSRHEVREMELEDVPESLAEALRYDEPIQHFQFHRNTPPPGAAGQQGSIYHGQGLGAKEPQHKEDLLRFFQKVDKGIHHLLHDQNAPLVLAGVEYLLPIYHEANSYPHLMEGGITGSPDELRAEELHERSWGIVAPHFDGAREEAIKLFNDLTGSERASDDLEEIVPAAFYGRVSHLFVAIDAFLWGSFDGENNQLEVHPEAQPGDEDLLDCAAMHTLMNGGQVYALPAAQVPAAGAIAAIFRY